MFCLKLMFHRTRPMVPLLKQVPGLSFPSGHAFMSFVFYGLVIYVVYKEVKTTWLKYLLIVLLLIMIFAIGLSRVYLRVHYASDVMAGFSFGMVSLVIILWFLNAVEKLNKKKLAQSVSITQDNA